MAEGSLTTSERPLAATLAAPQILVRRSSYAVDAVAVAAPSARDRTVQMAVKRAADLVVASLVLAFILPVMLSIAGALYLQGGKPLFRHRRIGRDGRAFDCLKFRTMVLDGDSVLTRHLANNPDAAEEWATRRKLSRDPRVTRLGAFLRATSLDELPQLLNVLRGEMSLVGPRPVVGAELEQYYGAAGTRAYTAMQPGITGLWQVSGRSNTSYKERVELDARYVTEWSLLLDLKIMVATIPVVLARRGAT